MVGRIAWEGARGGGVAKGGGHDCMVEMFSMEMLVTVSAEVRILQVHFALCHYTSTKKDSVREKKVEESESDSIATVHAGSNQEVS